MTAEPDFLASAYLDDELSDEERRLAEADPAVMAEVDQIRALRERIADVTPPTDAAREAAMAAAMEVFHEGRARAVPSRARAVRVLPLRRGVRYQRWLAVAAAAVVIGLLGVVIASGLRSGDDDAANEPITQPAAAEADSRLPEPAADTSAGGTLESELAPQQSAEESAADATAAMPAAEPASEPAAEPASEPAAEAAAEPAEDTTTVDPALFFAFNVGDDGRLPIENADQLAAAANYLLALADAGRLPPTPESSCPGPAFARALLRQGDDEVEVLIIIDGSEAAAYSADCDILLTASLAP